MRQLFGLAENSGLAVISRKLPPATCYTLAGLSYPVFARLAGGQKRQGILENLNIGDSVLFKACHIAQILIKKDHPMSIDSADKKALVSEMCFEKKQYIRYLYREAPHNDQDSGWRMSTGIESDDYMKDIKNIRLSNIGWLLDNDPSLLEPLKGKQGDAFKRDYKTSKWKKISGFSSESNSRATSKEINTILERNTFVSSLHIDIDKETGSYDLILNLCEDTTSTEDDIIKFVSISELKLEGGFGGWLQFCMLRVTHREPMYEFSYKVEELEDNRCSFSCSSFEIINDVQTSHPSPLHFLDQ